jgi:hypothetical protein
MISSHDRKILRDLAQEVAEIASLPIQDERRELWKKHNSLQQTRPMILVFPEGAWEELLPNGDLLCEDEKTRSMEWSLRSRIYTHNHFQDDTVIEKEWNVYKAISDTGWGIEGKRIPSTEARGAWKFDPVISVPSDLKKIKFPEVIHDERVTRNRIEEAQDLFGDILDIRLRGVDHISYHLMNQYTSWRGLEEAMLDMYLQPQMIHDAMVLLEEGHRLVLQQLIEQNLLTLNNDSTYHSSGGNGYTSELPSTGYDMKRTRPIDMWASAESQELAQVSPKQHKEFALQYEKRLLAPFGLTGYGCCDDLTHKLDDVFSIPNLRRISISPFANVDACAEILRDRYIFSWKPHPSHLVGDFDGKLVHNYISHTIETTRKYNCVLEMILKDTHTCEHHPERFDRWTQIAREV